TYYVEVSSTTATATTGEYVLRVAGNTVVYPAFQVIAMAPASGSFLTTAPTQITATFGQDILPTSVQAGDLTVDGIPATAFTQTGPRTVTFTTPAGVSGQGTHNVAIAANAITDLQGVGLTAFAGTSIIATIAPRVTATSLAPNAVVAPGTLTYQVTFSESMKVSNLSADDFSLRGNLRAVNYTASSFSFDASGTVLTLNYTSLP